MTVLPIAVVTMLASRQMREHHALWHFLRDRWHALDAAERQHWAAQGWQPPRLNPRRWEPAEPPAPPRDPDSGLDFLFMHRRMIERVDALLSRVGDPGYPRVEGWSPIPWDHGDPEWPMPPDYPGHGWPAAKNQQLTDQYSALVADRYENDAWLASVALDDMGAEIENGLHNWMHMHWASEPWFRELPGQEIDDPRNDYLGSTYASHVNPAFWKLHGWIDDRIAQWEVAAGTAADFSESWDGPEHPGEPHVHSMKILETEAILGRPSLLGPTDLKRAHGFFARSADRPGLEGITGNQ